MSSCWPGGGAVLDCSNIGISFLGIPKWEFPPQVQLAQTGNEVGGEALKMRLGIGNSGSEHHLSLTLVCKKELEFHSEFPKPGAQLGLDFTPLSFLSTEQFKSKIFVLQEFS